ncbi:MAG: hypothetical protein ACI87H_002143 [Gammaproteobacteria bacterium]|jgi:hypothetical protein
MRFTRPLLLTLCCTLLLASCSIIDIAYNNAATFVASEIEDVFELDEEQRQQLDQGLQAFFSWHRQQELRRYQLVLEQTAVNVSDGITASEFLRFGEDFRHARQRSVEYAIDQLGELAVTLTPAQVASFRRYSQEREQDDQDYLDKSSQQREIYRSERSMKRFEKWIGNLSNIQQQRIETRLKSLPDNYEPWIRYRSARQQALLALLEKTPASTRTPAALKRVLLDPSTPYAQSFERSRRVYWQAYAEMLEEISGWLTTAQKQKIATRLQDYALIAGRLHQQGQVTATSLED